MKNLFKGALLLGMLILCSCADRTLKQNEWKIITHAQKAELSIFHEELGLILDNVQLCNKDGNPDKGEWTVKLQGNQLQITITDHQEKNIWTFTAEPEKLTVASSQPDCLLRGRAPAAEGRIPARTEDQDNGILYTSLGYVSAGNITSLFDRETDTMIKFPGGTQMHRNKKNRELMQVEFPAKKESITLLPDYYINSLGLKYYQPKPERFDTAPIAWSSWYCYYMGATEEKIVKETDILAEHLKPYGLEYVQLDACYTRGAQANYLEWNKESFPQGGKWLAEYITSKGLKPALWVNTYGSNYANPESADSYPEAFYLRNEKGNLSGACCTADTTVVRLDYTHPDVIDTHLKPMFRTLKEEWQIKYLKDAGWGTWMDYYEKNRSQAYDSTQDSRDVYLKVQRAIRETVGDDFYIGGCAMHEVGLGFSIFDGSRTGGDDKAVWYSEKGGMSMQTYFHSLFGTNYLNNIVWHCDPDAAMVRNPLTLEEGRTIVSVISLTGQLYMASDFMGKLSHQKLALYQKTMPTTPVVPIDLYPYKIKKNKRNGIVWCCPEVKEFPRAIDLKVEAAAGTYDVVALFNWEDKAAYKTLRLSPDLGLNPVQHYIAFNFWEQSVQHINGNEISSHIPAHGTKVYIIHPRKERPQLIATSRHITSSISIKKISWDSETKSLRGLSEIIPGDDYSLFIHLPEAWLMDRIESGRESLFHRVENSILEVKFSGRADEDQGNRFEWTISFNRKV